MSDAANSAGQTVKDLYELGEIPPLGHVPKQMYAWAIRRERHGEPDKSFQVEVVDTPAIDSHEVLVLVMAAGVNYNGIWAGLGVPISMFDVHKQPYHIAGSDASGIVWKVGAKVKTWKVGDEVVIHCNQDDGDDEECNGGDPMYSPTQRIWGYETPDGSFAQFTRVQAVAATSDGFELAELDLEARSEGDVLGKQQSGKHRTLRLLHLAEDFEVVRRAYDDAARLVADNLEFARAATADFAAEDFEYLDKS